MPSGYRNIVFPAAGGATGGGITNVKISASGGSVVGSDFTFANSNGLTFGIDTAARQITASYTVPAGGAIATAVKAVASVGSTGTITRFAPEDHQHAGIAAFAVSNTGNTLGNTRSQVGTLYIAASGGITASQSTGAAGNDTVWLSVAAPVAQTNQSAIKGFGVSNTGATAGNTGISTGIDWVLAGSNLLTLSQSTAVGGPNTVWMQHPAWLTTAMASNRGSDFVQATAAFAGTSASGTIASNGISVSIGPYITTADLSQNSSKYVQNWKLTGNTAGTTSSAQGTDLWLAGGNGVTISGNSNTITISVATNYQSQGAYLTTADLSQNSSKYVQNWKLTGNTAGTTSSAQGTDLWFSGGNNVTISGNSNTIIISAFNQSNQSAIKGLGASNTGNTAGNTGLSTGIDWVLAGSQAVTISESTTAGGPNTLWINAPNAAAGNVTFSAGAASAGLASIVFSNSNGVSFGLNGSTITASANGGGGGIGGGVSTGGNTAGSTGTITTGNIVFVGSGPISLSQSTGAAGSNATISILGPATSSLVGTLGISLSTNGSTISVSNVPIAHFEPYPLFNALSTTWLPTSSSWYFAPFELAQPISGGRINFMVAHGSTASILKESTSNFQTNSSGTLSVNFTYARKAALYSVGAGTNSTRLESIWSNQWSLSIDQLVKVATAAGPNMTVSVGATMSMMSSIDSAGGVTTSTLGHSSTSAGAVSSIGTVGMTSILSSERNVLSSQLMIPIPFNTTLNPGQYYLAHMWITGSTTATTGGVTTANVLSIVNEYAMLGNTNTAARVWGQTAATSGSAPFMGVGVYSAGSASPPATIAFSDLRTYASMQLPYWNYQNSTI